MSALSRFLARKSRFVGRPTSRPWLERLEQRDCPATASSAVSVGNFAGRILSANSVVLTGNVGDDHPNTVTLSISGAGSSTTQVALDANNSGQFAVTLNAVNTGGTFFAEGTDNLSSTSATVDASASTSPTLTLAVNQTGGHTVRVTGTVNDANPGDETVTLSGVVSGTTTTLSDGSFVFTGTASALGTISATATNANGATSSPAQTTLTNVAPVISNFTAANSGNTWTMTGQVADEWAMGLTVNVGFPGLSSALQATVGYDDWFSVSTTVTGQPFGTATAQTTDWWGAVSNQAQYTIRSGN